MRTGPNIRRGLAWAGFKVAMIIGMGPHWGVWGEGDNDRVHSSWTIINIPESERGGNCAVDQVGPNVALVDRTSLVHVFHYCVGPKINPQQSHQTLNSRTRMKRETSHFKLAVRPHSTGKGFYDKKCLRCRRRGGWGPLGVSSGMRSHSSVPECRYHREQYHDKGRRNGWF
jgi:hypothetical protein